MPKNFSVSIQKKNSAILNEIIKSWNDNNLNISNEVCESILFKYTIENNPYFQKFLPTFNLIKNTLEVKDLSDISYEEAFSIALKNIFTTKINIEELGVFLEDDSYFLKSSSTEKTSSNTNKTTNLKDNTQPYNSNNVTKIKLDTENENNTITNNNVPIIKSDINSDKSLQDKQHAYISSSENNLNTKSQNNTTNSTTSDIIENDTLNAKSDEILDEYSQKDDNINIDNTQKNNNTTSLESKDDLAQDIITWDNFPPELQLNKKLDAYTYNL